MLKALTTLTVPTDAIKDSVVDSSWRNGSTTTANTPATTKNRHRDNEDDDDDDDTMVDINTRWEHLFRLLLSLLSMLLIKS